LVLGKEFFPHRRTPGMPVRGLRATPQTSQTLETRCSARLLPIKPVAPEMTATNVMDFSLFRDARMEDAAPVVVVVKFGAVQAAEGQKVDFTRQHHAQQRRAKYSQSPVQISAGTSEANVRTGFILIPEYGLSTTK
jgi:hypothetical protein